MLVLKLVEWTGPWWWLWAWGVWMGFNLLLLVSVLSMLQATLTLPGIAAIALTLGMAIDANVLINERVREELADVQLFVLYLAHRLGARSLVVTNAAGGLNGKKVEGLALLNNGDAIGLGKFTVHGVGKKAAVINICERVAYCLFLQQGAQGFVFSQLCSEGVFEIFMFGNIMRDDEVDLLKLPVPVLS